MNKRSKMFAEYNAWANARIYRAALELPRSDYLADRGAFFKSLHGTLNHLLVADGVWMKRFTGEGNAAVSLDTILFETLPDLWAARQEEDLRINNFVGTLDDAALDRVLHYSMITNPATVQQSLGAALDHFFNHQTHHRGQAHAILTGLGRDAPALDLLLFQRESGHGDVVWRAL